MAQLTPVYKHRLVSCPNTLNLIGKTVDPHSACLDVSACVVHKPAEDYDKALVPINGCLEASANCTKRLKVLANLWFLSVSV